MVTLGAVAKLPTKSSDPSAVERIGEILESLGVRAEYSAVDMAALQRGLTDGSLPQELAAKLAPFQKITVQERLRITKG